MKGNYRIRAYTQYMLNDGRNYVFDKAINISNAIVNKVFIKTTFNYTHQQANSPVGTTINYSDINGAPYINNTIEYRVLLNDIVVTKGKGVTDSLGNLSLDIAGNNPELLSSGRIVTKTYSPRQKVMLAVNASSNSAPALSSLSVAVTDETKVPVNENTENNI